MGRARAPFPRSRAPWPGRVLADPLARRYWAAALALAALSALLVSRSTEAAQRAEHAWGATTSVVVATRALQPGDPLAGATEVVRWPASLVPQGAHPTVAPGERAAAAIGPGTPLTDALVTSGRSPLAGRRLLAVPLGDLALPLEPGDRVELWSVIDPAGIGLATTDDGTDPTAEADEARPLATDVRVVRTLERAAVVAVATDEVGSVARALASGDVTVVGLP